MIKFTKKLKKFFNKYINGTKGAVAIFLALIMTPMLSIALSLVEVDRYQSTQEMMKEVVNASTYSTIADYDEFLDKRFGLLATSQEGDIASTFDNYMSANADTLGQAVTITSKKTEGKYALSNYGVLSQEIMENGKIDVLVELLESGFDIDDLIEYFEKAANIDKLKEKVEQVKDVEDIATDIEKIIEGVKEIISAIGTYNDARDEYEEKYDLFHSDVDELADEIQEFEETQREGSPYEDEIVSAQVSATEESAGNYKSAAQAYKDALGDLDDKVDDILSATASLSDHVKEFNESLKGEEESDKTTIDWVIQVSNTVLNCINATFGDDYHTNVSNLDAGLEAQISLLNNFDGENITSDYVVEYDNEGEVSKDRTEDEYGTLEDNCAWDSIANNLNNMLSTVVVSCTPELATTNHIGNMMDFVGDLVGLSGVYDTCLNADVSADAFYAESNMDITSIASAMSISALTSAGQDLVDALTSVDISCIVKVFKAVVEFVGALVTFLGAVVSFAVSTFVYIAENIVSGISSGFGEKMITYGYTIYNLPNRTTYSEGSSLNGYEFSDVFDMAGGTGAKDLSGSLSALQGQTLFSSFDPSFLQGGSGSDTMFKGAETEYLIGGSNKELVNQAVVFMDIFIFRFLVDFAVSFTNEGVKAETAEAGPYAILLQALIALGEALADTIVLVNGNDDNKNDYCYEYIYKKTFYFTPEGYKFLIQDLAECTNLGDYREDLLKVTDREDLNVDEDDNVNGKKKGFIKVTYDEQLLILFLISVDPSKFETRLKNIVNSEAYTKYDGNFDLDKSYCTLYSTVEYDMNPLFNIDGITNGGLFSGTSSQYVSY